MSRTFKYLKDPTPAFIAVFLLLLFLLLLEVRLLVFNLWLYYRGGLEKERYAYDKDIDVAKLAGHAVSKGGRTGPGSRVILESTKIRLYQFPSRVHSIKSGLVILMALFSVAVRSSWWGLVVGPSFLCFLFVPC